MRWQTREGRPCFFQRRSSELIVPENGLGKTNDNGEFRIRGVDTNRNGVEPGEYVLRFTWSDPNPTQPKYEGESVMPNPSPYTFPREVLEGEYIFVVPEKGPVDANFDF